MYSTLYKILYTWIRNASKSLPRKNWPKMVRNESVQCLMPWKNFAIIACWFASEGTLLLQRSSQRIIPGRGGRMSRSSLLGQSFSSRKCWHAFARFTKYTNSSAEDLLGTSHSICTEFALLACNPLANRTNPLALGPRLNCACRPWGEQNMIWTYHMLHMLHMITYPLRKQWTMAHWEGLLPSRGQPCSVDRKETAEQNIIVTSTLLFEVSFIDSLLQSCDSMDLKADVIWKACYNKLTVCYIECG